MFFHVFSVLPVSQYFSKIFLQVLQGLLVHLAIYDTIFSSFTDFYQQIFYGWWRAFTHIKQKKGSLNYLRL